MARGTGHLHSSIKIKKHEKVTVAYHGGCKDGYFSCCYFNLLHYVCEKKGLNFLEIFEELIEDIFENNPDDKIYNLDKDTSPTKVYINGDISKISEPEKWLRKSPAIEYRPYYHDNKHNEKIIKEVSSSDRKILVCLDISNPDFIKDAMKYFEEVIVMDHHDTLFIEIIENKEFLEHADNLRILFSKKHCASSIVFKIYLKYSQIFNEYFSKEFIQKLDKIQKMVTVGDTLSIPKYSKEDFLFKEAIIGKDIPFKFNEKARNYRLVQVFNKSLDDIYKVGRVYGLNTLENIRNSLERTKTCEVLYNTRNGEERKIRFLSVRYFGTMTPYLGHYVAEKSYNEGLDPVSALYKIYDPKDINTKYVFSLRRYEEGLVEKVVDLEEIAHYFGGGGHKCAAAFRINKDNMQGKIEIFENKNKKIESDNEDNYYN